jgi:hypothetical protein
MTTVSAHPQKLSYPRHGDLWITRHYPEPGEFGPGRITIDHADPRIAIARELLAEIDRGSPFACLAKACACPPGARCTHYEGARLEVRGDNRRVIYVIGKENFAAMTYTAEWPD